MLQVRKFLESALNVGLKFNADFEIKKRLATVAELTGKLPENWKCFEKEKENRSNGESVCHFGWFTKVFHPF